MIYALVFNNAVSQYPYGLAQLRRDNPQVSFPDEMSDARLAEYGVHRVRMVDHPAYDPMTQNLIEPLPVLIDGTWSQVWAVEPAPAEEIAQRQRSAVDAAADIEIKADTFVANFINMTPAQVTAYIDNNTATLAATRSLLKKMGIMLLLLAKQALR